MSAAVALMLVMVAMLLAAGCSEGKSVQEQDIEIVKINADGSLDWTKTIDYGNDEEMRDIVQMDDGSFVIAGGSSPKRHCNDYATPDPLWYVPIPGESQLIGLSSTGELLWIRNYSFNGDGGMITLFRNPDHSLEAITRDGELWHLNPDGSVITNRTINITSINSVVKTHDRGYTVVSSRYLFDTPGSNITRLDPEGTTVWQFWFNKSGLNDITPVVELPDQHGYLFGASYYDHTIEKSKIVIARLSPDGMLINQTPIAIVSILYPYNLYQSEPNGYLLSYTADIQPNASTTFVRLNSDGEIISSRPYDNLRGSFIPTNDEGFLSIDYNILKFYKNGTIQWKINERNLGPVKKVIQTSDNGFIIMIGTKKMSKC